MEPGGGRDGVGPARFRLMGVVDTHGRTGDGRCRRARAVEVGLDRHRLASPKAPPHGRRPRLVESHCRRTSRRGPFERSPSWPDPNGASHPSLPGKALRGSPSSSCRLRHRPNREWSGTERSAVTEDLPVSSSVGKRQRERQKLERAQAKAERRAARQAAGAEGEDAAGLSDRSEPELIDDLAALQRSFGDGEVSAEDFAERRDRIQAQLGRLSS